MFSTELQIKLGPLIATLTQPLNVERHLLIIAPEVHRERQTLRNSESTVSKRNINIILVNIIPFIAKYIMKQKFHRKLPNLQNINLQVTLAVFWYSMEHILSDFLCNLISLNKHTVVPCEVCRFFMCFSRWLQRYFWCNFF